MIDNVHDPPYPDGKNDKMLLEREKDKEDDKKRMYEAYNIGNKNSDPELPEMKEYQNEYIHEKKVDKKVDDVNKDINEKKTSEKTRTIHSYEPTTCALPPLRKESYVGFDPGNTPTNLQFILLSLNYCLLSLCFCFFSLLLDSLGSLLLGPINANHTYRFPNEFVSRFPILVSSAFPIFGTSFPLDPPLALMGIDYNTFGNNNNIVEIKYYLSHF